MIWWQKKTKHSELSKHKATFIGLNKNAGMCFVLGTVGVGVCTLHLELRGWVYVLFIRD